MQLYRQTMRYLTIFFLLTLCLTKSLAQTKPIFEKFNFDSSYTIIGVCSQLDEKKEYQKWSLNTIQLYLFIKSEEGHCYPIYRSDI